MAIKIERIQKTLTDVSKFGCTQDQGTTRLSYSKEFLAAQAYLAEAMQAAGLQVKRDGIGNLIGTLVGKNPALPAVMSGSHLDTVPQGGNFDGILGVTAALEVARSWQEEGYVPERSLQVIALVEEEGTAFGRACFGSQVRSGALQSEDPQKIKCLYSDATLADLLRQAGYPANALKEAAVGFKELAAYVELHIEQGMELEEKGYPSGIVTHIVGYDRLHIELSGEANHAGTTAMHHRKDALAAASCIVLGVQDLARQDKRFVATVGKLTVEPCVPNIVPGKVSMCIETRSYDDKILKEVREYVNDIIAAACEDNDVSFQISGDFHNPAVPLSGEIVKLSTECARSLNIRTMKMPSWAGHDAQIFASAGVPTGMLFVPSVKGISHAKEEFSRAEDILVGVTLLEALLKKLTM